MMFDFFEDQMNRLKPLGVPSGDDALDGYFDALRDIPPNVFDAAVSHALKTRTWYPKPAELRMDADHVAPMLRPQSASDVQEIPLAEPFTITVPQAGTVVSITREWKYYCDRCSDTGWAAWSCGEVKQKPWHELAACGRPNEHGSHEWVKHCACWASNPALVRKRENQLKYAASPQRGA